MRSSILLLLTVVAPLYCQAQFTKGDKAIGGTLFVDIQKTPKSSVDGYESSSKSFSISPEIGFFINESVSLGGTIGYNTSSGKSSYPNSIENSFHSNGFSIGLTARKYRTLTQGFLFSFGAATTYGAGSSKQSFDEEAKYHYNSFGISVSPAFHFFPTKNLAIEGGVGYLSFNHAYYKDSDRKSSGFHLGLGNFSFGLAYYLRQ